MALSVIALGNHTTKSAYILLEWCELEKKKKGPNNCIAVACPPAGETENGDPTGKGAAGDQSHHVWGIEVPDVNTTCIELFQPRPGERVVGVVIGYIRSIV